MKFLHIIMPDHSVWKVDIEFIADNRADYYSEFKGEDYDTIYKETIEDSNILIEWTENGMEWSDVSRVAIKIRDGKVDYEEGWSNGYKRIVN